MTSGRWFFLKTVVARLMLEYGKRQGKNAKVNGDFERTGKNRSDDIDVLQPLEPDQHVSFPDALMISPFFLRGLK